MKLKMLAASFAALAAAGVADAQDMTINDYVRQLVAGMAEDGETLVGDIFIDEIPPGDSMAHTFEIDPGKAYVVYAACDDDCLDIDLLAEDANGEWVGEDTEDDDWPLFMILPGESGHEVTVTLDMIDCDTDVCVFGVGLYEVEL